MTIDASTPLFNPLRHPLALTNPEWITDSSAWVTHIPFGMALVQMLTPRRFVELGTFKGDSYCAFCQAAALVGAGTKCFAIDTWQGDVHSGAIGPQVLIDLRAHHDPKYGSFSTLVQSEFDSAVSTFDDGSIDLLHIDGLHTYDAVRHDYQTWLPKLSDRAVVLFHDTAIQHADFGVRTLWAEIAPTRPNFEFHHGFGLGVLGIGGDLPQPFVDFLSAANQSAELVRQFFFTVGHRIEMYRIAKTMVEGHMHVHALIEQWLNARGQGLHALPSPAADPGGFLNRIFAEVQHILAQQK